MVFLFPNKYLHKMKHKKIKLWHSCLYLGMVLLICTKETSLNAQINLGGIPKSFDQTLLEPIPVINSPSFDLLKLKSEDAEAAKTNSPLRFALPIKVNLNLENAGVWSELTNGDRIWRLKIHAEDALSINFMYDDFYLPPGGLFYIYNGKKTEVLGAFAAHNNKPHRKFATALIHDDTAILEYYEPQEVRGQSQISISQIGHGYRSIDELVVGHQKNSGDCQVDVNCSPEGDQWQETKNSVTRIIMDGAFVCTGTLINNSAADQTPYVLSSDHCLAFGEYDAVTNPEIGGFVFYWNYERPECGSEAQMNTNTTVGASIVANSEESGVAGSDFALFLLDENPAQFFNLHFAGFDASRNVSPGATCIHHPMGDLKKVATTTQIPVSLIGERYWQVYWDQTPNGHSVTEGGSSGSALFNNNHQIMGQLYGGATVNCNDPINDWAVFGQLAHSWENNGATDNRRRLKDWLDPIGSGTNTSVDGIGASLNLVDDCKQLFISEYIEGTGLNRCIEIFNPNQEDIDLAAGAYQIQFYFEGSTTPSTIISLTDTIVAFGVYVICDDGADTSLLHKADLISYSTFFNGDDAIQLLKGNIPLDCFGKIGQDPGNEWGAGLASTRNNTLRRHAGILIGDRDPADQFDPSEEWEGFLSDDYSNLGNFDCDCQGPKCPLPAVMEVSPCSDEYITFNINLDEGMLSGPGLEGNVFSPRVAGPGEHQLIYITETDTCSGTIIVRDTVAPVLVGRQFTFFSSGLDYYLQDFDVIDFDLSNDDCGHFSLSSIEPAIVTCDDVGQTIEVIIMVEDDAGNEAQGTALITVESIGALPPPWLNTDIGTSNTSGTVLGNPCQASPSIQVRSNGYGASNVSDNAHFVYQQLCSDGSIEVEISDLEGSGYAGLMVRESLEAGAKMIALYTRFSPFIYQDHRQETDGTRQIRSIYRPGVKWLKLERSGSLITGYCSSNGNYWQIAFSKFIAFEDCLEVGAFAKSNSASSQCVATFGNLSLSATNGLATIPNSPLDVSVPFVEDSQLQVYPNPAISDLNFQFKQDVKDNGIGMIEIRNAQGQLVLNERLELEEVNYHSISVQQLDSGIYFLTVNNGKEPRTVRFVKN